MKILEDHDHWCIMQCDCGKIFEADATTEENLEWNKDAGYLVTKCPECEQLA